VTAKKINRPLPDNLKVGGFAPFIVTVMSLSQPVRITTSRRHIDIFPAKLIKVEYSIRDLVKIARQFI